MVQKEYDDVEDAIEQVRRGKAWAAIYLSENFTTYLLDRVCAINPSKCPLQFGNITNEVINGSSVHIYADVTSELILYTIIYSFCSACWKYYVTIRNHHPETAGSHLFFSFQIFRFLFQLTIELLQLTK